MARHVAFFDGKDAAGHDGLWETNGTTVGTFELTTVAGDGSDFTNLGNDVLFAGAGYNLWVTNGSGGGTHEVAVGGAYVNGLHPSDFTVLNGEVVFSGED